MVTEPSAKHFDLEKAEKKLSDNLAMYAAFWDDIINKREIYRMNDTYFDNNVTFVKSLGI